MSWFFHIPDSKLGTTHQDEDHDGCMRSGESEPSGLREEGEEEQEEEEGQEVDEGEEPCEETPEEEVKVEWPTGVPQASDKDLAKLSHTEGVGI